MRSQEEPPVIREALLDFAQSHEVVIGEGSIMPDHIHLAVRSGAKWSPLELLEGFKRACCDRLRRSAFWQDGGYADTFGEYRLDQLRENEAFRSRG